MDNIIDIAEVATSNYLDILRLHGYSNINNTNTVIVLQYLEDILNSELALFITEKDYNIFINAIDCLVGNTCLVELPNYSTFNQIVQEFNREVFFRKTTNSLLRVSENSTIRFLEI